jgi:adenylate cyclase
VIAWLIAGAALAAVVVVIVRSRRQVAEMEARLAAASHALESLQHAFSRFAPAAVVEDIIAQGVSTGSSKKDVTVLFTDLKGFTLLAERLDPDVLVRLLNGWVERMSRAVAAHHGHVAKLLGDGFLALFGALEANPWQSNDAVGAALAMRAALVEYNATLAREGLPPLAMGIGIHRGAVVAGVLGTAELVEYGVIGSTVNVASRVEELTRTHEVDILVSEAVRAALDRRFVLRAMPPTAVPGIDAPLATFAVDGFAPHEPPAAAGTP